MLTQQIVSHVNLVLPPCLCKFSSRVSEILTCALCILLCSCLCKVSSRVSDALLLALRSLSWFCLVLPRFTGIISALHWDLRLDGKACPHPHTARLACTTVLQCGHTFLSDPTVLLCSIVRKKTRSPINNTSYRRGHMRQRKRFT